MDASRSDAEDLSGRVNPPPFPPGTCANPGRFRFQSSSYVTLMLRSEPIEVDELCSTPSINR